MSSKEGLKEGSGRRKKRLPTRSRIAELDREIYLENLNLQQLKEGTHPEYVERLQKLEEEYDDRLKLNLQWKESQIRLTEELWKEDQKAAFDELVKKMKTVVKEKKAKKSLRNKMEDDHEEFPIIKCSLNLLLDEKEIEEDLMAIATGAIPPASVENKLDTQLNGSEECTPKEEPEVRIEHRKLRYDKKWFLRGQSIFVWGKDLPEFPAIIASIGAETISFKNILDEMVLKICITQLIQGDISIKRRLL